MEKKTMSNRRLRLVAGCWLDAVRDVAIAAQAVVGSSRIDVYSGTGALLRTISPVGVVGMTYVGDCDGDGVRDLLYGEYSPSSAKVTLTSGRTGATIRAHANV